MNRALYSGVAGLRAHQTKMDVIGNNISNVNTFGYKSQRAVFSDVFYQMISGATAGTTSKGGTNPSSVGYGSQLKAIQTQMSQSSMQSTGYGLDVAITGEGFFQVMDGDGNIFYTKAGILDYDANGYLVDVNGNFVLGSSSASGAPGAEKIKLDNLGTVSAERASVKTTINGIEYTISAANANAYGNVTFSIGASGALDGGEKVSANISPTGAISVKLSTTEAFASLDELNAEINKAITEVNGKPHAAGNFTIAAEGLKFPLTGAEICGTDFSTKDGKFTGDAKLILNTMSILGTSSDFNASGTLAPLGAPTPSAYTAVYNAGSPASWTLTAKIGSSDYTYELFASDTAADLTFTEAAPGIGTYTLPNPDFATLVAQADPDGDGTLDSTSLNLFSTLPPATGSFTAKYRAADIDTGKPAYWRLSMTIGGKLYSYDLTGDVTSGALQLKSADGDYVRVTNPSFAGLVAQAGDAGNDGVPDITTLDMIASGSFDVTPAEPSRELGLAAIFNLTGGTTGGAVSLDQISSIAIGSDGVISVTHSALGTVAAGKISLANFANPAGLQLNGTNYYSKTVNSGDPMLCDPGSNGSGELQSNTLELSNVDLSAEFAEMITTQRGFQANSRIITVSDTMLEELINLKR